VEGRQQRQTYRSTEWNLAIDRSLLDQTFCWCSPKGRGDRLKIGTVGVRIPPPAPACCIRLSPRLVSRRRLHQPDAANLRAANFSQRRPAPRHRRSSSSDFAPCPEARRARPNRPSCGREGLLGRVAGDAAAAREGQETFAAHRARTVAREARRLTPRSVRPRLQARTIRHTGSPTGRATFSISSLGRAGCSRFGIVDRARSRSRSLADPTSPGSTRSWLGHGASCPARLRFSTDRQCQSRPNPVISFDLCCPSS
jgi:hypothetical protein